MANAFNTQIVPTILVDSVENYQSAVTQINEFSNRAQIDITDGQFAPTQTVNLDQLWWPDNWQADIHMMVGAPSQYVDKLIELKPNMVIFHTEVNEDLKPSFDKLRAAGIKVGLALLKATVPADHEEMIKYVDHVLVFAGALGQMGGRASLIQLEKVRLVLKINPGVEIGWDGGVNIDNVFSIAKGHVHVINVGSTLAYANNPKAVYESMMSQIDKKTVI